MYEYKEKCLLENDLFDVWERINNLLEEEQSRHISGLIENRYMGGAGPQALELWVNEVKQHFYSKIQTMIEEQLFEYERIVTTDNRLEMLDIFTEDELREELKEREEFMADE